MGKYKNLMAYIQSEGVDVNLLQGLSDLEVDELIKYANCMGYLYGDHEEDFLQWLCYINRRIRKGIVVHQKYIDIEWLLD